MKRYFIIENPLDCPYRQEYISCDKHRHIMFCNVMDCLCDIEVVSGYGNARERVRDFPRNCPLHKEVEE